MMKTKTQNCLFLIISFVGLTFSCKKQAPETLSTSLSTEQKAFNIFYDSILYKKIYDLNDSSIIVETRFDSIWIENGMFFEHSIYSNLSTEGITEPMFDSLGFLSLIKNIDDSTITEAIGYLKFYDSIRNDTTNLKLVLPNDIVHSTKEDFLKRGLASELFVEIRKKIKSTRTQMVEIVISKNILFDQFLETTTIEWRLVIIFDLEFDHFKWYFFTAIPTISTESSDEHE